MKTKHLVTLLMLFSLLLTSCMAGTPESPSSTIASTTTVAASAAPGWTRYDSINYIHDLAFAPDGTFRGNLLVDRFSVLIPLFLVACSTLEVGK